MCVSMHLCLSTSLFSFMVSVIGKESIRPTSRGLNHTVSNDSFCFLIWMGRVKLKIKRLESSTSRLTTYSKRKNGLIKKANELSVLCDIDVVLLMFSPSGRPVLWKGINSSIEGIIERFAELNPQERAKRKLEIFDALKRSYRKSDHMVDAQDFFGSSYQAIGDLTTQANLLRTQLSEVHKRLSDWNNPDKIDNLELLEQMEFYIRELIDQIQTQKENIGKQHFMALGCTNQFQNGMHLPFSPGVEQQVRFFSWVQNDDNQHMVSPKDPKLLPKRETELSASNTFGNFSGYFGTVEKAEIASPEQESGILNEFLRTESLRNELIGLKTETCNEVTNTDSLKNELIKTESLRNELIKTEFLTNELMKSECLRNELIKAESLRNELIKTNSLRNELIEAESLRLQLYEQYSYPQYNFSILPDKKFQPEQQMNLQQTVDDYFAQGNFETPQSGYDFTHFNWASTSGPSFVAPFDERLYPQQHHSPSGHAAEELGPLYAKASHQLSPTN